MTTGQSFQLNWSTCAMQGWRRKMEDAHLVTEVKLGGSRSALLAGVFDGHGGHLVSLFCKVVLPKVVEANMNRYRTKSAEKNNDTEIIETVLKQSLMDIDRILETYIGHLLVTFMLVNSNVVEYPVDQVSGPRFNNYLAQLK